MTNSLFIEFRVHFDPRTNQDLLHELAEKAQEEIYNLFEGRIEETSGPLPAPHDVTYQVIMHVEKGQDILDPVEVKEARNVSHS